MGNIRAIKVNKMGQPVYGDAKEYLISNPDDHVFDSVFERLCWKRLVDTGIKVDPHPGTFIMYNQELNGGLSFSRSKNKLVYTNLNPIRYTPDLLVFGEDGRKIYIEVKDKRCESYSDAFRIRFNLFCRQLEDGDEAIMVFSLADMVKIMILLDKKFKLKRNV